MAEENVQKDTRSRNWSWIIYPESAPENWRTILDESGEKWIESPLHDKDINELTGEPKSLIGTLLFRFQIKKLQASQAYF